MKNLFFFLIFSTIIYSNVSKADQTSGSASTPLMVQCEMCMSVEDYKNKAKNYSWDKTSGRYVVVYSYELQSIYTFVVQKDQLIGWDDPIDPIGRTRIAKNTKSTFSKNVASSSTDSVVVTMQPTRWEIENDFYSYLNWKNSGEQRKTLELNYPTTGTGGASSYSSFINGREPSLLSAWALPASNASNTIFNQVLSFFGWPSFSHIEITFANGDVATLAVRGMHSALQLPLLFVVDENGDPISIFGIGTIITNVNGGGFGSNLGYTTFEYPSGLTVCYGSCPTHKGYVVIKRVTSE